MRKKNKIWLLFCVQLVFMFMGAISQTATPIALILSAVVAFMISMCAKKENGVDIVMGIVWLLILQNLMIGIGAHLGGNENESLKLLTQIPSITVFAVAATVSIRDGNMFKNRAGKFFLCFLCLVLVAIFIDRGQMLGVLMNIRNMTIFYFAFLISKSLIKDKNQRKILHNKIMISAKIVLIVGIILLVGGYGLYEKIGIDEVYIAKGSTLGGGRLDDRFFTTLIQTKIPRMGSLYYEPVNLAYYYASVLLLALYPIDGEKRKSGEILVGLIGLILSAGKGGIMIVLLCVGFMLIMNVVNNGSKRIKNAMVIVGVATILSGVAFAIYYYNNIGASASPHFWAVIRTWQSVLERPLGHGLGTGGNMSLLFNTGSSVASYSSSWLSTGGESALMAFMYQIGIPATGFLFATIYNLNSRKKIRNNSLGVFWFFPIAIFIVSILQDNSFTPQCIVLPMFIVGTVSNLAVEGEKQ